MSSQGFSEILSGLETALGEIVKSYVSEYAEYATRATALLATIQRYPDFVQETGIDDFTEISDLSDAVKLASEIVDSASSSPVINEMLSQIEAEFGISARTPLALAQNLLQGSDSNLLKVITSMILFNSKMNSLSSAVHTVYDSMVGINDFLADHTGLTGRLEDEFEIPEEIISRLEAARDGLQRSLGTPFHISAYRDNMSEVKEVAKDLENLGIFSNAVDAIGNIAIKMALDSTSSTVSYAYGIVKKTADDCKSTINIIKNTDTTVRTQNTARFVSAQKAVRRINGLLKEMRRGNVAQGIMIPKYIVALNVAYAILQSGMPYNSSAITPIAIDTTGITVTVEEIDSMLATCRKLLRATQVPKKLAAIGPEITMLYGKIQQFDSRVSASNSAIAVIAGSHTDAWNAAQTALTLISGLDFAKQLLTAGMYDSFFLLSEGAATTSGAAKQALWTLADACDKVSLTSQAAKFRKQAKDIEKQERESNSVRIAKKEKKKSKIVAQIEALNKISTELSELIATGTSTIQGIVSVIT